MIVAVTHESHLDPPGNDDSAWCQELCRCVVHRWQEAHAQDTADTQWRNQAACAQQLETVSRKKMAINQGLPAKD